MIKYTLKCEKGHDFDSWFGSIDDFERLKKAKMMSCAVCGSADVDRAIMAPRISSRESEAAGPLSAPASPAEQAVRELRRTIEENSDDVGTNFAAEARKMHDGDSPARSIFGKAKLEEARALVEDGIPVTPLPWSDEKKN